MAKALPNKNFGVLFILSTRWQPDVGNDLIGEFKIDTIEHERNRQGAVSDDLCSLRAEFIRLNQLRKKKIW